MSAVAELEAFGNWIEVFECAAAYQGRPRERLVALGVVEEMCFLISPRHYRVLQTVRIASELGYSPEDRDKPLRRCESRLRSLLTEVILDAMRNGDICIRTPARPQELAFMIWILAFGSRAPMDTRVVKRQLGVTDARRITQEALDLLLDTLG